MGFSRKFSRRSFLKKSAILSLPALISISPQKLFAANLNETEDWYERMKPLMVTYVSIAIKHKDRQEALSIIGEAFTYTEELIRLLSSWDQTSFISKLTERNIWQLRDVPNPVLKLIQYGEKVKKISQGRFSIFAKPVTDLWREAKESKELPPKKLLQERIQLVKNSAAQIKNSELQFSSSAPIDVGGVGKGLIADLVAQRLEVFGIKEARIACGGDLRFIGNGPWKVAIQSSDASLQEEELIFMGPMAVSTSGEYENSWEINGTKYHHLIDLTTGYPSTNAHAVTVVATNGALADAVASAALLMPNENLSGLKKSSGVHMLGQVPLNRESDVGEVIWL